MYDITKNVINSQRFELSEMCRKIDVIWLQGQLTDDQRTELLTLCREKADPQMSVDLYTKVMELEARVTALEPSKPSRDYPEFEVGHTYHNGDGVTFRGNRYRCTVPVGVACVWSPADYPAYWEQV